MTENFYKLENKHKELVIYSPFKKFKLIIEYFKTKNNCWDITRGTLINIQTNKIIIQIDRNYCVFHHSWLIINEEEWLQTGVTYTSQIFINCNTCKIYDNSFEKISEFCWLESWIANDQKTLIVLGCFWGGCNEYIAFDFNEILNKKYNPLMIDGDIIDCGNTNIYFENEYIIIEEYTSKSLILLDNKLAKKNKLIRIDNKLIIKDIEYYLPEYIEMYN